MMSSATPSTIQPKPAGPAWLVSARVVQIVVICLTIGLFIASLPVNYEQRRMVCQTAPCPVGQLTRASADALGRLGISVDGFVQYTIGLDLLVAVIFTASALIIFVRKPNDALTVFVTVMLVTFGAGTFSGAAEGIATAQPHLKFLPLTIEFIGNCTIIAFFFLFPSGRFAPRWSALIVIGWALFQAPRYFLPESMLNLIKSQPAMYNVLFIGGILSGLAAQVYRYRKVSSPVERLQTRWVVFGLLIGVGGYLAMRIASATLGDPLGRDLPVELGLSTAAFLFISLLPISITIAVLRYRLWDINPIINRTLVYGALSASTIAVYVLAVGFFSQYFQNARANFIISFIATGVIAVLFQPLRERLQRLVNRLMYGERDDPTTALTRLSRRLETALEPEAVFPTIVETLAQTLRLPYAAVNLEQDGRTALIAEVGRPGEGLVRLPLTYQAEPVGELLLAPRSAGESFSPADLRLLTIITQQAGIAAHTLRLTDELKRLNADLLLSRERLVSAQEEERRRLRRDLHDGVGPTLASLSQRIELAIDLVERDPHKSVDLLREFKGQVKGTVAEIRRLVYALRPPVLDEFGLVSAIREHVAPYAGPNGLMVTVEPSEAVADLPAAVEVAAYRIVLEAFTNVVQHAQASNCQIRLWQEPDALRLEVCDDGVGLPESHPAGVGLNSMRERAAELGGECSIIRLPTGWTCLRARLPMIKG